MEDNNNTGSSAKSNGNTWIQSSWVRVPIHCLLPDKITDVVGFERGGVQVIEDVCEAGVCVSFADDLRQAISQLWAQGGEGGRCLCACINNTTRSGSLGGKRTGVGTPVEESMFPPPPSRELWVPPPPKLLLAP